MIQGKNPWTKSAPKRSVRIALGPEQAGATTARGGGRMAVLPRTHGRASPLPPICFVFFRGLLFSCAFFRLLPLKEDVFG